MIDINEKSKCCGCSACVESCPVKCITLKDDDEGFLYPSVDFEKCISCGKCERVCPIQNCKSVESAKEIQLEKGYVAYSNDEQTRLKSSSGGIFSLLSENILKKDGIVVGAEFDENFSVHHIAIDSVDDLNRLRGSKYVQSRMKNIFANVKEFLENGKMVLFSGTSCQISGLKKYLGKEYDNLYTVDVLCHGVPSPKVWEQYLMEKEKEYKSKVKQINFRYKVTGWKRYSVRFVFENGNEYVKRAGHDPYMQIFLSNIALRPSCHDCRFKALNRDSDITIGDAWGVDDYLPQMDDDKGTSIIITHSDKGELLLKDIKEELSLKEAECDKILPSWSDARRPVKAHEKRNIFFTKFSKGKTVVSLSKMVKPSVFTRAYYKFRNIIKAKLKRSDGMVL